MQDEPATGDAMLKAPVRVQLVSAVRAAKRVLATAMLVVTAAIAADANRENARRDLSVERIGRNWVQKPRTLIQRRIEKGEGLQGRGLTVLGLDKV